MSKNDLTAQRLRELLHYDPETGVFTRLTDAGRWKAGAPVGSTNAVLGYVHITCGPFTATAHRLAWLYVTGNWPAGSIDHLDGNRSNNRFSNLRDVPHAINLQNRKGPQIDNKVGLLGVTMRRGKYRATIKLRGTQTHLGDFSTPDEAHAVYLTAKRQMHSGNTL